LANQDFGLGGIIEVITNAVSRNDIGNKFDCDLKTYFERLSGSE
jgi:hypothetical protein